MTDLKDHGKINEDSMCVPSVRIETDHIMFIYVLLYVCMWHVRESDMQ